ncbi:MAG TPA: winged helix-turn-helix domain-containing protein [Solirubrobacterales bacterium]|nr:winged helix-turn-helix domain-containing protein [Solirubrobacterales bacterium]
MAEERHGRADQELVRALSHPVRLEILQALQGRIASPAELSREIDQRPGVVSFHASTLLRCGCIELVHSRGRRGGIENFFAVTPRSLFGDSG